jgi:hypothetical protein
MQSHVYQISTTSPAKNWLGKWFRTSHSNDFAGYGHVEVSWNRGTPNHASHSTILILKPMVLAYPVKNPHVWLPCQMSDVRVLKVLAFTTLPAPSPPSKDLAAWYSFSDSKKPLCVFTICHSVVFFWLGGGFSFHGSQNHSGSFTYNSCIMIRNDSENPQQTSYESPPSNRVPGCPCRNGPRLQGTNDGPWQESEGSQGMKIPSPSITFLFPLRNFANKMHQKSKSTYWHTTSYYYVDARLDQDLFTQPARAVIFSTAESWWTRAAASHRVSWVPLGPTTSRSCGFSSTLYPGKTRFGADHAEVNCWNHRYFTEVIWCFC